MYCIYHSRDLDGYCSGAIIKKYYPDCIMIGFDYGQSIPYDQIKRGEKIIMVDVSLPMNEMVMLGLHSGSNFIWIDHHASAINDYNALKRVNPTQASFISPVLKQGLAGCEITWNNFYMGQDMPAAVELLGQYDTFRNENKSNWNITVLPFQYGMRSKNINSAETFPQDLLNSNVSPDEIASIIKAGNIVLSYQKQIDTANMQSAFEVEFEGLKGIACNGAGLGSMAFDSVPNITSYDLMIPFKFNGTAWTFSLYTAKDNIDCSQLAKKYGGGGHKAASGFMADKLPDFILKNKK